MAIMPNPFEFAVPQAAEQAVASPSTTPGTVDATAAQYAAEHRFVLDEQAFMDAIEPLPMFLQAPIDVVEILAGHGA